MNAHAQRSNISTMKFGGTSLGSADAIARSVEIVASAPAPVAVVASAMSGVTDLLLEGTRLAASGASDYLQIAERLSRVHLEAAQLLNGDERQATVERIETLIQEFIRICDSVRVLGEASPRALDFTTSLGERMSVRLLAAALRQAGLAAEAVDSDRLIVTDSRHQDATPSMNLTREQVQAELTPLFEQGKLPVITGFIGATPEGETTTLGRGGSDFSAGLIAASLDSRELVIWTDVDGVMTADPRIVAGARSIDELSFQEVRELSYFGAKVLHPKTIQSVADQGIPIRVMNTFNPSHPGTLIAPISEGQQSAVKAVTAIQDLSLISVEGKGMMGVPGIAARTFEAVAGTDTSVLLISQASSEQSICFAVPRPNTEAALAALHSEFELALERGNIDEIRADRDIVIVTAVGAAMRHTPGVAGRIFTATGSRSLNVIAIAQGSSECSISLVVQATDGDETVRAIHDSVIDNSH